MSDNNTDGAARSLAKVIEDGWRDFCGGQMGEAGALHIARYLRQRRKFAACVDSLASTAARGEDHLVYRKSERTIRPCRQWADEDTAKITRLEAEVARLRTEAERRDAQHRSDEAEILRLRELVARQRRDWQPGTSEEKAREAALRVALDGARAVDAFLTMKLAELGKSLKWPTIPQMFEDDWDTFWGLVAEMRALLAAEPGTQQVNDTWREDLWAGHGCLGLYGDDGEMQCVECGIDFKRDAPLEIAHKFSRRLARVTAEPGAAAALPIALHTRVRVNGGPPLVVIALGANRQLDLLLGDLPEDVVVFAAAEPGA